MVKLPDIFLNTENELVITQPSIFSKTKEEALSILVAELFTAQGNKATQQRISYIKGRIRTVQALPDGELVDMTTIKADMDSIEIGAMSDQIKDAVTKMLVGKVGSEPVVRSLIETAIDGLNLGSMLQPAPKITIDGGVVNVTLEARVRPLDVFGKLEPEDL